MSGLGQTDMNKFPSAYLRIFQIVSRNLWMTPKTTTITGELAEAKICEPNKKSESDEKQKPKDSIFGGFSFKLPPSGTGSSNSPETKNLSFGTSKPSVEFGSKFASRFQSPTKSNVTIDMSDTKSPASTTPFKPATGPFGGASHIFGNVGAGSSTFESLSQAASTDKTGFKSDGFKGFPGSGAQLFGGSKGAVGGSRCKKESESGGEDENYEPNVDFKPVVPLPDLVEVSTGEEEEEKLFSERAKLFRFDLNTKEYKERGLGDLKILKHRETGKIRIVMRREQVLKLCANHYLTGDMTLSPLSKSDRAYVWHCHDFSEGELVEETLAAKFKTPEIAEKYKEAFENAVKETKQGATGTPQQHSKAEEPARNIGFGIKTKQDNTWECSECLVPNKVADEACCCCGTGKDGTKNSSSLFGKSSIFGGSALSENSGIEASAFHFGFGKQETGEEDKGSSRPLFGFSAAKQSENQSTQSSDKEVEIVGENAVSEESKTKAEYLQLPEKFFSYEHKPPCPGCLGCKSDEEIDRVFEILNRLQSVDADSFKEEYDDETGDNFFVEEQDVWECQATLVKKAGEKMRNILGVLKVIWDNRVNGYRLDFFSSNDGTLQMSHIIAQNYCVDSCEVKKRSAATWHAVDLIAQTKHYQQFSLVFSSPATRDQFIEHFQTGVKLGELGHLSQTEIVLEKSTEAGSIQSALQVLMKKPPRTLFDHP